MGASGSAATTVFCAAGTSFAFATTSGACAAGASATGVVGGAADSGFSSVGGAAGGAAGTAALGAAGFGAAAVGSAGLGAVDPAAGGFTTTPGGTTVTIGRVATAPAGAFATTAPDGGFEAMAGAAGGIIAGACLGCGTIFRGSAASALRAAAPQPKQPEAWALPGLSAQSGRQPCWEAHGSCEPRLPPPAFWQESPSSRRRASRRATNQSFGAMVCAVRDDPAPAWPPWRPC